MNEELKKRLIDLAKKKHSADREDFMPDDVAAGNIDDAFYSGTDYGEICFAREICNKLGWEY